MNITSYIISENFETFIKGKLSYIWEKLLKKVSKKYYSEIEVFIKQNTDILLNHRPKNHEIELLKGKQALFV